MTPGFSGTITPLLPQMSDPHYAGQAPPEQDIVHSPHFAHSPIGDLNQPALETFSPVPFDIPISQPENVFAPGSMDVPPIHETRSPIEPNSPVQEDTLAQNIQRGTHEILPNLNEEVVLEGEQDHMEFEAGTTLPSSMEAEDSPTAIKSSSMATTGVHTPVGSPQYQEQGATGEEIPRESIPVQVDDRINDLDTRLKQYYELMADQFNKVHDVFISSYKAVRRLQAQLNAAKAVAAQQQEIIQKQQAQLEALTAGYKQRGNENEILLQLIIKLSQLAGVKDKLFQPAPPPPSQVAIQKGEMTPSTSSQPQTHIPASQPHPAPSSSHHIHPPLVPIHSTQSVQKQIPPHTSTDTSVGENLQMSMAAQRVVAEHIMQSKPDQSKAQGLTSKEVLAAATLAQSLRTTKPKKMVTYKAKSAKPSSTQPTQKKATPKKSPTPALKGIIISGDGASSSARLQSPKLTSRSKESLGIVTNKRGVERIMPLTPEDLKNKGKELAVVIPKIKRTIEEQLQHDEEAAARLQAQLDEEAAREEQLREDEELAKLLALEEDSENVPAPAPAPKKRKAPTAKATKAQRQTWINAVHGALNIPKTTLSKWDSARLEAQFHKIINQLKAEKMAEEEREKKKRKD